MMPVPPSGARLSVFLGLGSLVLAACTDEPPLCEKQAKECLSIDSYDIELGGIKQFEVRLSNVCQEAIEFKLCFEVKDEAADCRQKKLTPAEHAEEDIPLDRFGGRTRIFMRFSREARACHFPLTRDVEF